MKISTINGAKLKSGYVYPVATNIYVPKYGITISSDDSIVLMYEDNTTNRNKYFQFFSKFLNTSLASVQVSEADKFAERLLQEETSGRRYALTSY